MNSNNFKQARYILNEIDRIEKLRKNVLNHIHKIEIHFDDGNSRGVYVICPNDDNPYIGMYKKVKKYIIKQYEKKVKNLKKSFNKQLSN